MDTLRSLHILLIAARLVLTPILEQVTNFTSRSSAIGFIFMLLIATSALETLIIGIFRIVRLSLILILTCLFSTELFRWLWGDVPATDEENEAARHGEDFEARGT